MWDKCSALPAGEGDRCEGGHVPLQVAHMKGGGRGMCCHGLHRGGRRGKGCAQKYPPPPHTHV